MYFLGVSFVGSFLFVGLIMRTFLGILVKRYHVGQCSAGTVGGHTVSISIT